MAALFNLENYYYGKFYGLYRVFTGYFGVQKVSPDRKAGITATNRIYIQSFLTVVQTSD